MFAILFEVLLIEIQEEIHHFAGWEGGGVKGRKNYEREFCAPYWRFQEVALFGCGPSRLNGYNYPGGGTSDYGGPEYNLIPKESMLVEREAAWWGDGFDVFPANKGSSTLQGAQTGFFFRIKGPLFNTYGYEDTESSKITMYMRQRFPQSYFYMAHA